MPAARAALGDEPRGLQRLLDEGIREPHVMVATGDVTEVADVVAGVPVARTVTLSIEAQDALHLGHRHRTGRSPAAMIEEPVVADLLIAQPQAPHRARTDAEYIGHLQPALSTAQGLQDHFLHLHGPLHGGPGVGHRHLPVTIPPPPPAGSG